MPPFLPTPKLLNQRDHGSDEDFPAALLDIKMPKLSGIEALRSIKAASNCVTYRSSC